MLRLVGNYEAMKGGSVGEALEDFTGGVLEYMDLTTLEEAGCTELFETLLKYQGRASLMGASIKACTVVLRRTRLFTIQYISIVERNTVSPPARRVRVARESSRTAS